ncbi:hypothetical protein QYE76_068483 [Lolium multiflorum]|uniref:PPIase cyclophilin-type domain-containing protein n=1 Tax=Lolium multiflorum TaxID=4521 RepID=A0AAD8SFK8_LOLMU|nr:hypothetical protein QYE76_068483 [Lolium multiflorum]
MPPLYTEHDWILMYPSNTPPCPPLTCSGNKKDFSIIARQMIFTVRTESCADAKCIFGLRSEVVPKMIGNFHFLCTGEKGDVYKGCFFHRIIKGFHDLGWGFCRKTMSEEH